jgi:CBS domain-containing protein
MGMKLANVMTREVDFVSPEDSLQEAARHMAERGVGALPVCDGGRLVGMVTDRDIVVRSVARGEEPRGVRVADAMTYDVECCTEDSSLEEVGRRMAERQVRRIVVLDDDKKMVGIVSLGDLARARGNSPIVARAIEEISEPTKQSAAEKIFPHAPTGL